MSEAPAFEVRSTDGTVQRIWIDGRVEGFDPFATIINRIPAAISQALSAERQFQDHVRSLADRKATDQRRAPVRKFKDYFAGRHGKWPTTGERPPEGSTWEGLMFEAMADYLDLVAGGQPS